jgi:hypothetical protein
MGLVRTADGGAILLIFFSLCGVIFLLAVFVPFFLFFTILGLIYLNRIEFASSGD